MASVRASRPASRTVYLAATVGAACLSTFKAADVGGDLKAHRTLRRRGVRGPSGSWDDFVLDSQPFCAYGTPGSDDRIEILITHDNVRKIRFAGGDLGTQSFVRCHGAPPARCSGRGRARGASDGLLNCAEAPACPCRPAVSRADMAQGGSGYATKTLDLLLGACHSARGGSSFRALFVGLGGGMLPSAVLAGCPNATFADSIEIDPRVTAAATRFFGFRVTPGQSEVEAADGGQAVQRRADQGQKYDFVAVDAFGQGDKVPKTCSSAEFVANLRRVLRPGGRVVQNIFPPRYGEALKHYRSAFGADRVRSSTVDALSIGHLIVADMP